MLKLSIIVPAYNAEHTIKNALNSILRQRLEDAELIIINDGSTDSTLDIVNHIAEANRDVMPITVISHPNKGLSETRNIGIRAAQGRYWTTVDADDELVDGGIQAMLAAAERDGYPEMVYGSFIYYDKWHNPEPIILDDDTLCGAGVGGEIVQRMRQIQYICAWSKFYNREFTVKHDLWFVAGMIKNEDIEFTWRMLPLLTSATLVSDVAYHYLAYNMGVTTRFYGQPEIDSFLIGHQTILANLPKILTGEAFDKAKLYLEQQAAYTLYAYTHCLYRSKTKRKRYWLKAIVVAAKEVNVDLNKFFISGFPKLFARLLKTGTLLPHIAMTIAYRIPALRNKAHC